MSISAATKEATMMQRQSRDVWAKRVQRWAESDLTAKEFAAAMGINASTLTYWKYRLAKEAKAQAAHRPRPKRKVAQRQAPSPRRRDRRPRAAKTKPPASVDFLELTAGAVAQGQVEIHLRCGRRLIAPATTAPAALAELADHLERGA